ncbi:MAG: YqiJ family protein [Bdellovibrionales bacterium]|nr:YqiJ family protein [Bdellovibrionales bacterium]
MGSFLTAAENLPFGVALALMFCIALLEGVGALLGVGVSSIFDSILPDFDLDMDGAGTLDGHSASGGLTKLLGWLRFGKVPALMLLLVLLTAFGLLGYLLQGATGSIFGFLLPAPAAAAGALIAALPVTRWLGGLLAAVLPDDESSAVSSRSFIGRVATVTSGTAKANKAVQAKLRDEHGQTHYIMVEPDEVDGSFDQGASVLVVKQDGAIFKVIANPNEALVD